MSKHINRLERYVDSMSSLQRMEDITPDYQQINLSELIEHTRQTADIVFGKSDKTFDFHYQVISYKVMLDVEFFSQVFENLVSNAIRYATKKVDINVFETADSIGISISDDGTGFSADSLEKATEPYYTGSDRTSEHFGLGLYICKLLCEHHGGNIELCNTDRGAKIAAYFKKYTNES